MKSKTLHPLYCIPFIFLFSFLACNDAGKSPDKLSITDSTTRADSLHEAVQEEPLQTTEDYVATITSRRDAIAKQIPGIKAAAAVQLYNALVLYMDTALAGLSKNEGWLENFVEFYSEKEKKMVPPPAIQKRIDLLATAGIEPMYIGEGYTELRTVPNFYIQLFQQSLPMDYRQYLRLKADEDTVLYSADAGIMISFNLVGQRVLNWERFLHANPTSIFQAEARTIHKRYLFDYLMGEDNTPSFDNREDISSLNAENRAEYVSFVEKNGNTKSGEIVKQFLDRLNTEPTVQGMRNFVNDAIDQLYEATPVMITPQPGFQQANIENLTKSVYDTAKSEVEIDKDVTEKMNRTLDSVMYFQQDNSQYCVAVFKNQGASGSGPVSGWVDVWAFKQINGQWKTVSFMLQAGGGGMYGNSGYFNKLIKLGDHVTGIVVSGGITHMGSSISWDDVIELADDKLSPAFNLVTYDGYDNGSGFRRCHENKWYLQKSGTVNRYDLVITSCNCSGTTLPLEQFLLPYKKGGYDIPSKFHDKGI